MARKASEPPADAATVEAAQKLADQGKAGDKAPTGDDEQQHQDDVVLQQSALDRLEAAIEERDFDTKTLVHDICETMVEMFKRRPKAWGAMSPAEQQELAKVIQFAAQRLVQKAVNVIAAEDRQAIRAVLEGVTIGDKITGKFKLAALDDNHADAVLAQLYHANKKTILIIPADAQQYEGKGKKDIVDPEEPELFASDTADGIDKQDGAAAATDADADLDEHAGDGAGGEEEE